MGGHGCLAVVGDVVVRVGRDVGGVVRACEGGDGGGVGVGAGGGELVSWVVLVGGRVGHMVAMLGRAHHINT